MSKRTFASRTFASRSFASGSWAGVGTSVTGTFDYESVISSVFDYFSRNFSDTSNIEWDLEPFDPDGKTEWIQVIFDELDEMPIRKTNKERMRFRLTCFCWSKTGTDIYRDLQLSDAAADALDQKQFPVKDFDESNNPQVGYARTYEPATIDLSRGLRDELKNEWNLLKVQVEGLAEQT